MNRNIRLAKKRAKQKVKPEKCTRCNGEGFVHTDFYGVLIRCPKCKGDRL